MSSLLLDTCVFIWVVEESSSLPLKVKSKIENAENIFVSIVSFWEIAMKSRKEKILFSCELNEIEARFQKTDFELLPISIEDTIRFYNLPLYRQDHKDPFDRILISQALNRSIPLVTSDSKFNDYPIEKIWK
ncbi:MAG: PIN domain nuclease [Pseudanabaena sp.]|nr:MAG: PIN domain nuclease [Pseudanabaena sp.]